MNIKNCLSFSTLLVSVLIIIFSKIYAKSTSDSIDSYIFMTKWGSEGSCDGQFKEASGIAVDSEGYIYIADTCNQRIQKFDSTGNFIIKWGSEGSGDGQFLQPLKIVIDCNENVYVADHKTNYIQKFNSNGKFIIKWITGWSGLIDLAVDFNGIVYTINYSSMFRKYNSEGTRIKNEEQIYNIYLGNNGYMELKSIAVDLSGYIYLLQCISYGNMNRFPSPSPPFASIKKYDKYFNPITEWGSEGKKNEYFQNYIMKAPLLVNIAELAVDSNYNIYVLECANNCIQKFDSTGNFITKWGSEGSEDGQFKNPSDIAVDQEGNIYVIDTGNNRVQKFKPNPDFKSK